MMVSKELLKSRNVPDIESIPISSKDYINESKNMAQEQIKNILFPEVLSLLQHGFKSWHEKLSQFHPKYMFRRENLGFLPSLFLYLKDDSTLCESLTFVIASRRRWIKKGDKSGSISK